MQLSNRTPAGTAAPLPLAARAAPRFKWHLEFECDATPYIWHGYAASQKAAIAMACADLADDHPWFTAAAARCVTAVYSAVVWPCSCSCAGEGGH